MTINTAFIRSVEGFCLKGYVPDPASSKSGVTIATGFDIGQRSEADLIGLPTALRIKLHPYLHLRGPKAVEQLHALPLEITQEEAERLDALSQGETLRLLQVQVAGFNSMPDAVQTVAFSLALQYGDLRAKCPRFFSLLTGRDWQGLYEELRDFGDNYPTRRNKEANYLSHHLQLERKP